MKKLLSLGLALLLCLGLIPNAYAYHFTDNDTSPAAEQYQTALDLLYDLNIMVGFEDGSLRPKDNLSRAQYIKMLYVVINSGKDDKGVAYNNADIPFTDIESSAWFEGYVKWAYGSDLVAGRGGALFAPNDSVSGYEALKMSLTALGYSQKGEGFTGDGWQANVLSHAEDAGLLYNLSQESLSLPASREEAAQMLYNMLFAQLVTYESGLIKGDTMAYKYFSLNDFSGARALEYANHYSSFGLHRTGTETEIASAEWLAGELEGFGFETQLQQITFNRFDLKECKLTVGGKEIKAFPFWFPASTGSAGVEAQIVAYNEDDLTSMAGKVVYYDMPGLQSNANIAPIAYKAKEAGAIAVISTVTHPNGLPAAQNAVGEFAEKELALPSVVISMTEKAYIAEAISEGAAAWLLIDGTSVPDSSAYNVIGKLDNKADKWVVVTTPISGWFTCNAERGGGVGLFLELARTVKTWDKSVNYLFMGNTGHELNFMGSHHSDSYAPDPAQVKVWIHFGSGIAASEAVIPNYKFFGFSEDIEQQATEAFKDVPEIVIQNDQEKLMQSELGSFISKGYTALGLYGANKHFHTEADTAKGINGNELTKLGQNMIKFLKDYLDN